MADADIKIKISKDPGSDLDKALKDSQSASERLVNTITDDLGGGAGRSLGSLATLVDSRLLIAFGALGTAVGGLKIALDFTLEAERMNQVKNSFDALAASAKLAGDQLSEGLIDASAGLADDDDILQAANRAIIQLGERASILPETMELARKATAGFGGELIGNFGAINDALASGNVRALRNFGIILDSDKAIKDYARNLGVTGDVLTENGKRTAIMNAALEQMRNKFSDVDETSLSATNSLTQFKVALLALKDQTAESVSQSGFFKKSFDFLKDAVEGTTLMMRNQFGSDIDKTSAKLRSAQESIDSYSSQVKSLKASLNDAKGFERSSLLVSLNQASAGLARAKAEFRDLANEKQKFERASTPSGTFVKASARNGGTDKPGADVIDFAALAAKRAQAESILLGMRSSLLAAREASAQQIADVSQREIALDQIASEKRLLIAAEFENKKRLLKGSGDGKSPLSPEQQKDAEIALETEKAERIGQIQDESRRRFIENQNLLRDSLYSTFKNGAVNSIQSFATALVNGENAFSAFGKSLLSMLGDLAIQLGTTLLFAGEGLKGLFTLNPTAAIGAGIGLIAVGSLLKAFASKGSAEGGSIGASTATSSNTTNAPDLDNKKSGPSVAIHVQGHIFDSKESGLRIADILNQYVESNDGKITVAS